MAGSPGIYELRALSGPPSFDAMDYLLLRKLDFLISWLLDCRSQTPRLPDSQTPRLLASATPGLLNSLDSQTPGLDRLPAPTTVDSNPYWSLSSFKIASSASMTSWRGTFPLRNLSFRLKALLSGL